MRRMEPFFIDLFFLIDILLNFFTSYRHQGIEVTEKHLTVRHYLKTVFVVDLVANFPLVILLLYFDDIKIQCFTGQ